MTTKNIYDYSHVKGVSYACLSHHASTRPGGFAGRIVANWSDNPAGSVCTAQVSIWEGPLACIPNTIGRAGGYGYDKLSAAIQSAITRAKEGKGLGKPDTSEQAASLAGLNVPHFADMGFSEVRKWFESLGYVVVDSIGTGF